MAKVVVIEDEEDLRNALAFNLSKDGHEVFDAGTGSEGVRLVSEQAPDIILLDLILPDLSGLEVCKQLKSNECTRGIPVMMLTARGEEADRISGFEAGAEDYLVKPVSLRELALRIDVITSRCKGEMADTGDTFGVLRIDRNTHQVWVGGQECNLTALELRLLLKLYDDRQRVHSRAELLRDVWSIEGDVVTRTVDTHIKRLREKIGSAGVYIITVRGVGYRFARVPQEQG